MTNAGIESEKRFFKRLVISHHDLSDAADYADFILNHKLHESRDEDDEKVLRGLNLALVVSYWRPFSGNRVNSSTEPRLIDFEELLTPDEMQLHERIRRLRDKDHAHSDADAHGVTVRDTDLNGEPLAMPIGRNTNVPLDESDVTKLRGMIDKLSQWLRSEWLRIQKELPSGTRF